MEHSVVFYIFFTWLALVFLASMFDDLPYLMHAIKWYTHSVMIACICDVLKSKKEDTEMAWEYTPKVAFFPYYLYKYMRERASH